MSRLSFAALYYDYLYEVLSNIKMFSSFWVSGLMERSSDEAVITSGVIGLWR